MHRALKAIQWFAGKSNNVVDALSRDWHRNKEELTFILRSHFSEQMPENFRTSQHRNKINSWLISLLQQLPMSKQLLELHTTTRLKPGSGGGDIASLLDATTPSLTGLVKSSKISCSEHLPWLSEKAGSRKIALNHWLKFEGTVQGAISHVVQAFQDSANRIPLRTQTTCLACFYQGSAEPIATVTPSRCNKMPYPLLCLTN